MNHPTREQLREALETERRTQNLEALRAMRTASQHLRRAQSAESQLERLAQERA